MIKNTFFFHSKIKKPAENAKIRLKIRRSRGALIAGTTICLYENKTTEMGKSFTFKIQKYDQKYGSFSQQNWKNLVKLQKYASKYDGIEEV